MADINCPNCNARNTPNSNFCSTCGAALAAGQKAKQGGLKLHLIILGILALAAIIYMGFTFLSPRASKIEEKPDQPISAMPQKMTKPALNMEAFIKNLPTEYESLVSMGNALMDQEHYALAIECYQRALQQRQHEADVRVDLGACQHFLGQNDKAIDNFLMALKDNPGHQIAKMNLGIAYMSAADTVKALEWWQKLLRENPADDVKTRTQALLKQIQK